MQTKPEKDLELRAKVNRETARLPWTELLKHFAQGNVVWIANSLDLVDVAVRISHDDKATISQWMSSGQLAKRSMTNRRKAGWKPTPNCGLAWSAPSSWCRSRRL